MAFINERIPEEEKEKFNFSVSTRPDGSKPTLWKWTIDRERKVFLVITNIVGGGYSGTDPTEYFVLCWNNQLVKFSGNYKISGSKGNGYTLTWRLSEVEIPPAIEEKRSEVTSLIREALDAKGRFFNRANLVSVVVES
ncbi:MAG: hypothetical protein KDI43_14335 [Gammaproteobacteria bacterium]|nr:hypothetical protein [Gammaproteobacteria bacterium]MCP5406587.1 hypothetical protein [Chromatiaceae bacterium]